MILKRISSKSKFGAHLAGKHDGLYVTAFFIHK